MRNITVFWGLVTILFCAQVIPAQEKNPYAVSLGYQAGFLYGQSEEIVYPGTENKAEFLSQLLWDMKPVWYNGLTLDFAQTDPTLKWGFFSNLSLKYGIPGRSGKMKDRDWLSYENSDLTNYSSHDNTTKELFLADFSAGFSFPLFRIMLLKPFLAASYMRFSFSGTDGSGIYARSREEPPGSGAYPEGLYHPFDDNPRRETFSGKVINYNQEWLTVSLGHSLRFYFHSKLYAELSFLISPFIFCADLDEHYYSALDSRNIDPSNNRQFRDYMFGGLSFEPGAELSFSPTRWLSFSLNCSWRYISRTRGKSYNRYYPNPQSPIIEGYTQDGEAGAGLSIIDTSLCVKVRL